MRLGIHLPQFRDPADGTRIAEFAHAAEEGGADDVWVSDHVIVPEGSTAPPESFHDGLTVLTWAAAHTERVGLGTSVLVAPYRPAVILAKAIASLDALSGGRVILGLGSGWMEEEFAAIGAPFSRRGHDTDATIRVCRELWTRATADGMTIRPRPARAGGPPIWVGGNGAAGMRRALRSGDAWHITVSTPTGLPEAAARLDAALQEQGRDRSDCPLSVRVRADETRLRRVAPRLQAVRAAHVLVDDPDENPDTLVQRLHRMRDILGRD